MNISHGSGFKRVKAATFLNYKTLTKFCDIFKGGGGGGGVTPDFCEE